MNQPTQMSNILNPLSMPLQSRHLIEASAGTGKTYNITRIYVRLLLEKGLSVKQILVMTFTEAATEEIRVRIASFIAELLANWNDTPCEYSQALQQKLDPRRAKAMLEVAALELDLASIYTIHGFCQRVLTRFGMSVGTPMNATLRTTFSDIFLNCIADSLMNLRNDPDKFECLQTKNWHDPATFLQQFSNQLMQASHISIKGTDANSIYADQMALFNQTWSELLPARQKMRELLTLDKEIVLAGLANNSKNRQKLQGELQQSLQWLSSACFIDESQGTELIEKWLSGELKNDDIHCKAFKSLLTKTRLKSIDKQFGDISSSELYQVYTLIIDALHAAGFDSQHKTRLKEAVAQGHVYAAVLHVIQDVQQRVAKYKTEHKVIGFDDLIVSVSDALTQDNQALIDTLRDDYPVALVDEFQDTDIHQYRIFERLYPKNSEDSLLVMIGDPKQAIYSFRGGDIFTYLQAKQDANYVWNMGINYRSRPEVIESYNRLFFGKALGKYVETDQQDMGSSQCAGLFDYGIEYHLIGAPPASEDRAELIDSKSCSNAVQFVVSNASRIKQFDEKRKRQVTQETPAKLQCEALLHWFAQETLRLFSECSIKEGSTQRPIVPQDIAILVRDSKQANWVKKVFSSYKLASVYLSEKSPLFSSVQATQLYWVLTAIHMPSKTNVRKALTTGLLLPNIVDKQILFEVLQDDEHPLWENVILRMNTLGKLWKKQGVFTLIQTISQDISHETATQNPIQIERVLTNYLHLAEELAIASVSETGPLQLLSWFQKQILKAAVIETSQLRLESDDKLIKIVTQHKSKGLEYPIVFMPFANYVSRQGMGQLIEYHNQHNEPCIQLGWSPIAQHHFQREQQAEDMRLLYVSLTRPILKTYIGMIGNADANKSAIMRALDIQIDKSAQHQALGSWLRDKINTNLNDISARFKVTMANELPQFSRYHQKDQPALPQYLRFSSTVEKRWQVTSFSQLSHAFASVPPLLSDVNKSQTGQATEKSALTFTREEDEYSNGTPIIESNETIPVDASLHYAFEFPKGAQAGNYLHDLLEMMDFSSANIKQQIIDEGPYAKGIERVNTTLIDIDKLTIWVADILHAVLPDGNNNDQYKLCLAKLTSNKVLKEPEFYFPLHGFGLLKVAELINEYRMTLAHRMGISLSKKQFIQPFTSSYVANDLLTNANKGSKNNSAEVSGAMHGFIDLIFEHQGKYYVADYKSNYLGNDESDYKNEHLVDSLISHNYDIQYLIYSLALHRYLHLKLPNYDYGKHYGGVYYLFLRGMRKQQSTGVFFDKPDASILYELDALCCEESNDGNTLEHQSTQGHQLI